MEGSPAVRRFLHERSQAASNGFSGITEHETRDTAFSNHGYCRWPFAGSRSRSRYASRDTKHGFTVLVPCQRFPTISHYFPVVPRYPPPPPPPPRKSSVPAHSGSRVSGFMDASSRRASAPGQQVPPDGEAKYARVTNHGLEGFSESRITRHETRPSRPFGSPWVRKGGATGNRRPDHCARRQVTVFQFTIVHNCSLLFAIVRRKTLPLRQCPCPVSRSPSASRRAPLAGQILLPSGLLRCRERHTNPC